jgi:hypothetical protein
MTSDYMPPNHLSHLHHARQKFINRLPQGHDLRKRVRCDDNGELLPEQPPGRRRTSFKWPPVRKRRREISDPRTLLGRRILMKMWNEKYHLNEEWDRVHGKMLENRKKFGLRERPYTGFPIDSRKRSRESSQDTSSDELSDLAARIQAKKKRKIAASTGTAGDRRSDDWPVKRPHRMAGTLGFGESSIPISISIRARHHCSKDISRDVDGLGQN